MPGDESFPLLKVYRDIGAISEGIANLSKGQEKLVNAQEGMQTSITDIKTSLANVVTKEVCAANHPPPQRKHKPTTDSNRAVGAKLTLLQRLADNAGNLTKVLTLVASVVIGLWAIHKFATKLEASLERTEAAQTKTTKQLIRRLDERPRPAVVYVPLPVVPDAGPTTPRRRRTPVRRAAPPR